MDVTSHHAVSSSSLAREVDRLTVLADVQLHKLRQVCHPGRYAVQIILTNGQATEGCQPKEFLERERVRGRERSKRGREGWRKQKG